MIKPIDLKVILSFISTFLPAALLWGMLLSGCRTARPVAGRPFMDSSLVFTPRTGEYASMRIPALVMSKNGALLAFCEGRINSASDWGDMDLLLRRSTDGGRTWGPYQVIAARKSGPTSNPTPIVDANGVIHLLYQRDYALAYYTRSEDDGRTWTPAVDITATFEQFRPVYSWKVLAPGPGHAIQLKNGRLLAPVWLSDSEKLLPHRSHSPTAIATVYSDDTGRTWKAGEIAAVNAPDFINPNENMAVELEDGRVMLNIRTGSPVHLRGVSYSPDGISQWSKPVYDSALFDPVCMASIIKIPSRETNGKSILLFMNPDSRDIPKNPRRNLTARLSFDEGHSWPVKKVIAPGPAGYSDIAVGPDGTIYCLYETNSGKDWNYSLMLKRFNMKWLLH